MGNRQNRPTQMEILRTSLLITSIATFFFLLLPVIIRFQANPPTGTPTSNLVIPTNTQLPITSTSTPEGTFFSSITRILGLVLIMLGSIAVLIILIQRLLNTALPIAHNVAVIGFPRSGKTTIITSLFGEIFARKVTGVGFEVKLSGKSTIERINQDLATLQRGLALGPTSNQNTFAYRTIIRYRRLVWLQTYKVEIGDFPGERSQDFVKEDIDLLQSDEYFKWVLSADAIVFVIDLGKYLPLKERRNYVAGMTSAIRSAWQKLVDSIEIDSGGSFKRNFPVVLVFHKMDLVDEVSKVKSSARIHTIIASLGYGKELPEVKVLDENVINSFKLIVQKDFIELIRFLSSETKDFTIVYTSCFGIVNGNRLGLIELLKGFLPK